MSVIPLENSTVRCYWQKTRWTSLFLSSQLRKTVPDFRMSDLSFVFLCPVWVSLGSGPKIKYKSRPVWQKKGLHSGIDWDRSVRHLVLLSVICVKIYRNIQILEYRFDIGLGGRGGDRYNSLTSERELTASDFS